ncbi:class I SAM-dependent methyltransferase [Streptomyces lydicus]
MRNSVGIPDSILGLPALPDPGGGWSDAAGVDQPVLVPADGDVLRGVVNHTGLRRQRPRQSGADPADADTTHLTLAAVDFATADVADVLARAGHDAQQSTLFIGEHLVLFLEPGDVARLLAGLSGRAATGSILAITAEVHPAGLDSALVVSTVDEVMFAGAGPLHTIQSRDAWLTLFKENGWHVDNADDVTAVNHFELPIADQTAQIQTQFLTATTA